MRTLALTLVLAACTQSSGDQPVPPIGDIQMNDLSVLLPLATTAADFAALPSASSPGPRGAILPEALYDYSISLEFGYDTLRAVAFRFDPCFANLGPVVDPASCDNQLRVVFEPLTFADGVTTAADAAVHVAYSITRAQLVTAVNAIAAARELTTSADLGPLAVHPIVSAQGLTGALARQLIAILAQYADATKIERITFLFVPDSVGIGGMGPTVVWDVHGYTLALGVETPLPIPTLSGQTAAILNASVLPLETLAPATDSPDNIAVIESADQAMSARPAERQNAYDAALRIEDPTKHSANTIDCASCHMTEPARRLVAEPLFSLSSANDPNAFEADPSIPAADLVTATDLVDSDNILDIHAFSYRGSSPMINQRVVNETAANLAYLRTLP